MHWGACELSRNTCREVMDKKKDRGAAKVVNFCLAEGTKVLTKSGYKAIEDVLPADRLWDGTAWVKHKGVEARGKKIVIPLWDRLLWCTPDHIVYTTNGPELANSVWQLYKNKHKGPRPVKIRWDATKRTASSVPSEINCKVPTELIQTQHLYRMMQEMGDIWSVESCKPHLRVTDPNKASVRYVETYDIVDVGPNNRFVANGVLVHNSSSYGGTATSISRKIEADTGVKASPEEAQALLDAVERRQPRATEFFKEMEKVPETQGFLRAPSGRIRHCHTMAKGIAGMGRAREGQITALGRECRNFP